MIPIGSIPYFEKDILDLNRYGFDPQMGLVNIFQLIHIYIIKYDARAVGKLDGKNKKFWFMSVVGRVEAKLPE